APLVAHPRQNAVDRLAIGDAMVLRGVGHGYSGVRGYQKCAFLRVLSTVSILVQVTNLYWKSTMKLLHIDASILGANSASRQLSAAIVARLRQADPAAAVTYRDLAATPLGHLSGAQVAAAMGAAPESLTVQQELADSQAVLREFLDADTVTDFTRRAFGWFEERGIAIERLMTDNHFSYTKSTSLAELLDRRAVSHLLIRPYTPRTNGKVERFHQTLMREWAYALEYASSDARGEALPHWIEHYNKRRSHSALGNRPPMARVRDVLGFDS
ncbi:MAG: integrase core domain-containing protein, partial [Jatrophihabitantaceae bacterium]